MNGNDQKIFYNTTLLVNERPIKFIIDSGSPVTLIPKCLKSKTTGLKPLNTTFRNVNNHQIEFTGQTKAMLKTNNKNDRITTTDNKSNSITVDGCN